MQQTPQELPPWRPTTELNLTNYFYHSYRLTLNTGREIGLTKLHQFRTYGNVIEGMPGYSPSLATSICERYGKEFSPIVIIDQTPLPLPISQSYADELKLRHNLHSLAPITVLVQFESNEPAKGAEGKEPEHWSPSGLSMLWFQKTLAMPIDELILEKIKAVNWDAHAENWDL